MRRAKSRSKAPLGNLLEKNLVAYAAAAGASLLTVSLPADAQIIYTPSNTPMAVAVQNGGPALTPLDLNNDGSPDFNFILSSTLRFFSSTFVATTTAFKFFLKVNPAQKGNQAVQGHEAMAASALSAGAIIGPQQKFGEGGLNLWFSSLKSNRFGRSGSWQPVEYAYVGLKFSINGQTHYGWARIKFAIPASYYPALRYPSIYGYAYESTPNKPILAGQTSESSQQSSERGSEQSSGQRFQSGPRAAAPANLGMLALGAAGLDLWRRNGSANPAN
jgi:hypothetical protein